MRCSSRSALLSAGAVQAALAAAYGLGVIEERPFLSLLSVVATAAVLSVFARTGAILRRIDRNTDRIQRLHTELCRVEHRMGSWEEAGEARHEEHLSAVSDSRARMEQEFRLVEKRFCSLDRAVHATHAQTEAFIDLRALVQPRAPLPPLGGWAASAGVLRPMIGWILDNGPKTIVECGSGSSSVWLGYIAERTGSAVVALEHDADHARATRELVRAHGLSDVVDVRLAPLEEWESGGETWRWYARDALEGLAEIGLIFVDGPPGATGPTARYPALPLLLPLCAETVAVFLDDAAREQDRAVSDRWAAEFPELVRSRHRGEKGLDTFMRSRT
ncbi:class I SAM-dependent methyltransferase [Planomonospora parontospora]|uniref:class I SAM-dependent methyltransferase n=1 Tax=Planomonospora parontospora TaxID=58119 RepID=UPI00166F7A53|nr:class I SAM-dependent methyltransferase [Planomonospora parontospora]